MAGRTVVHGLRGEIGSSSINSPCNRASRAKGSMTPMTGEFGNKENLGAEARAATTTTTTTAAAAAAAAVTAAFIGRKRTGIWQHPKSPSIVSAAASAADAYGISAATPAPPPHAKDYAAAPLLAAPRGDRGLPSGGPKKPLQPRASKTPLAARTRGPRLTPRRTAFRTTGTGATPPSFSPPQPLSPRSGPSRAGIAQTAWTARDRGGCTGRGGMGGSIGGSPCSSAARRVALRAARGKVVAIAGQGHGMGLGRGLGNPPPGVALLRLPSSKLVRGTAATAAGGGRAGDGSAYTPPSSVRPRFVHRRRCVGNAAVGAGSSGEAGELRPPVAACAVSRDGNGEGAGFSGRAHNVGEFEERRDVALASEYEDEAASSVMAVSSAELTPPVRSIPERGASAFAGAGPGLMLLPPPTRCDDDVSRELEAKAVRRSLARNGNAASGFVPVSGRGGTAGGAEGGLWRPLLSAPVGRLSFSLETAEDGDEVLLSPWAKGSSVFSAEAVSMREGGGGGWEVRGDAGVTSSVDSAWSMASVDEMDREPNARESHMSGGDPVARMLLGQSDDDIIFGHGYHSGRETPCQAGKNASSEVNNATLRGGGAAEGGRDTGRASPPRFAFAPDSAEPATRLWTAEPVGFRGKGFREAFGGVPAFGGGAAFTKTLVGRKGLVRPIALHRPC